MDTPLINNGWLHLINGTAWMKLACKQITWDWPWKPQITHYAGNGHYGIDLEEQYLVVQAKDILFNNRADFELFCSTLRTWQTAGTFTISISYDGSGYIELDGTNTAFTVLSKGPAKNEKIAPADGTVYKCGQCVFEQAG